jgi:hypothetical protein
MDFSWGKKRAKIHQKYWKIKIKKIQINLDELVRSGHYIK